MSLEEDIIEISNDTEVVESNTVLEDHNYNLVASSTSKPLLSTQKSHCYPDPDKTKHHLDKVYSQLAHAQCKSCAVSPLQPKEKDECDIYSKLLAIKLRRLPRDERMIYMNRIDGLFVERIYRRFAKPETPYPRPSFPKLLSFNKNSLPIAQTSSSEPIIKIIIPEIPSVNETSYSEPIENSSSPNEPSMNMEDAENNKIEQKEKKQRRQRRYWMANVHRNRTREALEQTFYELLYEPSGEFDNFCCMTYSDFELLLNKISPLITKQDTSCRKAIPAKYRLALTLRYLASGDSFASLHHLFKVSVQSISKIVPEVCKAINEVLKDEIKMPTTAEDWINIAEDYSSTFPHCVGSLDAKRIIIGNPHSENKDRKKPSSIVLMTLIDSNYKFIFAEVGNHMRQNDGDFFNNSLLWQRISKNEINFPEPCPLPGGNDDVPYVFLADSPFALSTHVMKPYPGEHDFGSPKQKFNQCFYRSRDVVENVFGVISSVFRLFRRQIDVESDTVSEIMMTCVILHNCLIKSESSAEKYIPPGTFDEYDNDGNLISLGSWRSHHNEFNAIKNLRPVPCRTPLSASLIREEFTSYFCRNMR